MIDTIFLEFDRIFTVIWNWLAQINEEIPFLTIALGIFLASTIMRFIVFPMLKPDLRAGSDSVKPKKERKNK